MRQYVGKANCRLTALIPYLKRGVILNTIITVFLVDDHALVRKGLRHILETVKGIQVIGEACNGQEAL